MSSVTPLTWMISVSVLYWTVISAGAVYIALQTTGYAAWSQMLSTECRVELDDVYMRHFVCYRGS